jgi:hypothetical protein
LEIAQEVRKFWRSALLVYYFSPLMKSALQRYLLLLINILVIIWTLFSLVRWQGEDITASDTAADAADARRSKTAASTNYFERQHRHRYPPLIFFYDNDTLPDYQWDSLWQARQFYPEGQLILLGRRSAWQQWPFREQCEQLLSVRFLDITNRLLNSSLLIKKALRALNSHPILSKAPLPFQGGFMRFFYLEAAMRHLMQFDYHGDGEILHVESDNLNEKGLLALWYCVA